MNLLFTICARAGSKGVKSKNTRNFLDIPLAYYTIAAYIGFVEENRDDYNEIEFALNTDSEALIQQFNKSKVPYVNIPRIEELAGDRVAKADVICDTLRKVEKMTGKQYDIVVDLDLTSPLRTINDIKGCINKLIDNNDASVAYTVTNSRRQPHFNLVLETPDGYLTTAIPSHFTTRQEAPKSFDMNASIYAYRRIPLLNTEKSDVFDGKCVGWIMRDTAVLDIDSEEDYEIMQVLAKYFFEKDNNMKNIAERAEQIYNSIL